MRDLTPGALIVVRYGRDGEQLARYLPSQSRRNFRAIKWRSNSRRWTNTVAVPRSYFLRVASPSDLRRFGATCPDCDGRGTMLYNECPVVPQPCRTCHPEAR